MLETASKGGGIAKGYLRGTKEGVRFASAADRGSHRRTAMDTLTKLILTRLVGAAIPLVSGYIRLLSRFPGADDG